MLFRVYKKINLVVGSRTWIWTRYCFYFRFLRHMYQTFLNTTFLLLGCLGEFDVGTWSQSNIWFRFRFVDPHQDLFSSKSELIICHINRLQKEYNRYVCTIQYWFDIQVIKCLYFFKNTYIWYRYVMLLLDPQEIWHVLKFSGQNPNQISPWIPFLTLHIYMAFSIIYIPLLLKYHTNLLYKERNSRWYLVLVLARKFQDMPYFFWI